MAIVKVNPNGKAPTGLKTGDSVVTGGGTYTITGVNPDGTYKSTLTNPGQTTGNYTGGYNAVPTSQPPNNTPIGAGSKPPAYYGAANRRGESAPANAFVPMSYIDSSGEKKQGYAVGDKYIDTNDEPIENGSVIDVRDKQYIKTPEGSMLYSDYIRNKGITETTIYNPETGERGKGYLSGGKTYTDILLQNPVGVGTVVDTDAGQYIKTPEGSMLYSDYLREQKAAEERAIEREEANLREQELAEERDRSIRELEQLRDEIDRQYEKALATNDSETAAQLEQQRLRVQGQLDSLNRAYAGLNKQLYRDYMQNSRNLPQALSAQGITGGLAESSLINLAAGYEGNLAENERNRIAGVSDIEAGRSNAELELKIAQAAADRQAEEDRYARLASVVQAMQNQRNYLREQETAAEDKEYQRRAAEADRALENAKLAAAYGDYGGLNSLGITPNNDNVLASALAGAGRITPVGSGGGSKSTGGYTPTGEDYGSYSDAAQRFMNGDYSDAVIQALISEGYTQQDIVNAGYRGEYFNQGNKASVDNNRALNDAVVVGDNGVAVPSRQKAEQDIRNLIISGATKAQVKAAIDGFYLDPASRIISRQTYEYLLSKYAS